MKKNVRESGYATVKSFIENHDRAYEIVAEYQKELRRWEQQTGKGMKNMKQEAVRQKESVREKLMQLVKKREQDRKVQKKGRGAR